MDRKWLFNTTDGERDYDCFELDNGELIRVYEDGTVTPATEIDYEVFELINE